MRNAVIIYTDTTSPEAVENYVKKWSIEQRRAYNWQRRRRNMAGQKIAGLILLAITVPAVRMLDGDATVAAVTIPAGIGLLMSTEVDKMGE